MRGYLGVMNVRSIKEALEASNDLWTRYPLLSRHYMPLVGFDVNFIKNKEDTMPLEERLAMFCATSIDYADFALCYPSQILNASEFFQGLEEVLKIPEFKRKTKAVYFSGNWPGISISNELKFKFPNLKIISAIERKDDALETLNEILKILGLYRRYLDCLATAVRQPNGQKTEYESLDGKSRYLELHDISGNGFDSGECAKEFIKRVHMQELKKVEERKSFR